MSLFFNLDSCFGIFLYLKPINHHITESMIKNISARIRVRGTQSLSII